jgi:hypothetical protein
VGHIWVLFLREVGMADYNIQEMYTDLDDLDFCSEEILHRVQENMVYFLI